MTICRAMRPLRIGRGRNGLSPLDPAMAGVRLHALRIASGRSGPPLPLPLPRFAGEGEGVAKEGEEGLRSAPRGAFLSRHARLDRASTALGGAPGGTPWMPGQARP